MTSGILEGVREAYDGLSKGDVESGLRLLHPDVVWDVSRRHIDPGVWRGIDAVRDYIATLAEAWESQRLEPEDFIEVREGVVLVPVRIVSTSRSSGLEIVGRGAHVWHIEDGLAIRHTLYQSSEDALADLEQAS